MTPAVVFAELAAVVSPVQVPLSIERFNVASFAADCVRVNITAVVAPLMVKNAAMTALALSAALMTVATCDAVEVLVTVGVNVMGEPVIPAAVSTTEAVPVKVTVPATVAVSTCATPLVGAPALVNPLKYIVIGSPYV